MPIKYPHREGTIPLVAPPQLELKAILFGRGWMTYQYDSTWGLRETSSEANLYDLGYVLKASNELNLPRIDVAPDFTRTLAVGRIIDFDFMAYKSAWDPPTTKAILTQNQRPLYTAKRVSSTFIPLGPGPVAPDRYLHLARYHPDDQWLHAGEGERNLRSLMIRASLNVKKDHVGEYEPGSEHIFSFTAQYWILARPSDGFGEWGPLCTNA
ncbi:MAG: hypothetical protein M1816_005470 [Peltula sp. TS41687]|nr:MAG: hypothetical protein M1816_005470 [Peltula sp. TS41687]